MNIIVDGLLTNYSRQGKGTPLLMLHGWGDQLETFNQLATHLDKDYEIIRLDLPGFGKSQPSKSAWGLSEFAQFIGHFLEKIEVKPTVILGHSNGGAIAIIGLSSNKLQAGKLILLSSAGIRSTQKTRKLVWQAVAKTGKVVTAMLPRGTRQSLRSRLYHSVGSDLMVAPHMEATFKRIVNEDVQAYAASLRLPTLIINGADDTATPPEFARIFNQSIDGSSIFIVDGADHFIHQSDPEKITGIIKEFLRK